MNEKTEIVICLGSSCFSRGNKQNLQVINQFIRQYNLENKVNFHGNHCFGMCNKGPIIKIREELFTEVKADKIIEILKKKLIDK